MQRIRRLSWWAVRWMAVVGCLPAIHAAGAEPEIVVAIRYLQGAGVSHSHLYLYREDGKLLRQLTRDDSGQDRNPLFDPAGENIVFTRELPGGGRQWWTIQPHGENIVRLAGPPEWYARTKPSPHFEDEPSPDNAPAPTPTAAATPTPTGSPDDAEETPRVYRTPDGAAELVLKHSAEDSDAEPDGREFLLRDVKTGEANLLGKLPGFEALGDLMGCRTGATIQYFLLDGPLRAAFFWTHLNSTDGETVHALDLTGKRLVRLSPNRAEPYPLPGEAAFLTLTEERYVPFGGGERTANCSYVDRWDAGWKRVRYAREKAPAVCYGASLYRAGKTPPTVTVLVASGE